MSERDPFDEFWGSIVGGKIALAFIAVLFVLMVAACVVDALARSGGAA